MKMKYYFRFIYTLTITFYSIVGYTQTYIGVTTGADFLNASTAGFIFYDIDNNTPIDNKSLTTGIYIEQFLSKRIKLTLHGGFTSKNHEVADTWGPSGNPFSGIKYNSISSSFSINYAPIKHFYIGAGIGLNYLRKMKIVQRGTQGESPSKISTKIVGGVINASYHFKSFRLNLQYFQGCKFINDFDENVAFFDKFNSFEISLGYSFKLFGKIGGRRKGKACPTF